MVKSNSSEDTRYVAREAPVGELNDLRQLRIFQALAKTESFTKTAQQMSVTQSAVSHSLKNLETTLGFPLFDRHGRSLSLTREGETLLSYASEILRGVGRATQELSNLRSGELSTLRFGSPDSICEFILPDILMGLHLAYPDAEISLKIADTEDLDRALTDGTIDIMLGISDARDDSSLGVFRAPLFRDCLHIIHNRRSEEASRLSPVDLSYLAGERILLFGPGSITNRLVRSWLEAQGVSAKQVVEVRSLGAVKELVKTGYGVALLPRWVLREEERSLFAEFSSSVEPIERQWSVSMRRAYTISELEKNFLAAVRLASARLN
ncbi:MAG: LysR family transcriptional regulator [Verrucomicrobiota bacterium]